MKKETHPPPEHEKAREAETHDSHAEASAKLFLAGALQMQRAILEIRTALAADRAHGLRDATAFAGHLARGLIEAGAQLPQDRNPNPLRWFVDEGGHTALSDPDGATSASALATFVFACLRRGKGADPLLERVAAVWPKHRAKAAADQEVAELDRADGEAMRLTNVREHEARLAAAHEKAKAAAKPPTQQGGPVTSGPYQRGTTKGPEGEFMVGDPDDFSGGKRPLTVG
jgi:hypothetical protein